MGVEVPLDPGVSTVLGQTCGSTPEEVSAPQNVSAGHRSHVTGGTKPPPLTYAGLVDLHVEGLDQVLKEGPDQPEVDPTDAPGAVHQDDDVGDGWGLTHEAHVGCRDGETQGQNLGHGENIWPSGGSQECLFVFF